MWKTIKGKRVWVKDRIIPSKKNCNCECHDPSMGDKHGIICQRCRIHGCSES